VIPERIIFVSRGITVYFIFIPTSTSRTFEGYPSLKIPDQNPVGVSSCQCVLLLLLLQWMKQSTSIYGKDCKSVTIREARTSTSIHSASNNVWCHKYSVYITRSSPLVKLADMAIKNPHPTPRTCTQHTFIFFWEVVIIWPVHTDAPLIRMHLEQWPVIQFLWSAGVKLVKSVEEWQFGMTTTAWNKGKYKVSVWKLVAESSTRRAGFDNTWVVLVGFVLYKVAKAQVFLEYFGFSLLAWFHQQSTLILHSPTIKAIYNSQRIASLNKSFPLCLYSKMQMMLMTLQNGYQLLMCYRSISVFETIMELHPK